MRILPNEPISLTLHWRLTFLKNTFIHVPILSKLPIPQKITQYHKIFVEKTLAIYLGVCRIFVNQIFENFVKLFYFHVSTVTCYKIMSFQTDLSQMQKIMKITYIDVNQRFQNLLRYSISHKASEKFYPRFIPPPKIWNSK